MNFYLISEEKLIKLLEFLDDKNYYLWREKFKNFKIDPQNPDISKFKFKNKKRFNKFKMFNYFPKIVNLTMKIDLSNELCLYAIPKGGDLNKYLESDKNAETDKKRKKKNKKFDKIRSNK